MKWRAGRTFAKPRGRRKEAYGEATEDRVLELEAPGKSTHKKQEKGK